MNNVQSKSFLNSASLTHLAIDLLLSISIGFLISILMVLFTIMIVGPKFSIAEIVKVARQIFSPTAWEYDRTSGMAFLIPISSSAVSIFIARYLIKISATRKNWAIATIVVGFIAFFVGILSTMRSIGLMGILWIIPSLINVMSPIGASVFFVIVLIGLSLGIIFLPQKYTSKILVASITASLIGGLFELFLLGLALYEAF